MGKAIGMTTGADSTFRRRTGAQIAEMRKLVGKPISRLVDRLSPDHDSDPSPEIVRDAWLELRAHPRLLWVPPVWRASNDSPAAREVMRKHALSAVDRNLLVDLGCSDDGSLWVRLATGPLTDRSTSAGLDPVGPAGRVDPKLDVTAGSFPQAVVALRDALVSAYPNDEESPERSNVTSLASLRHVG